MHRMQGDRVADIPTINVDNTYTGPSAIAIGEAEGNAFSLPTWGSQIHAETMQLQRRSSEPSHDRVLTTSASVCSDDVPRGASRVHVSLNQYQSASFDGCLEEDQRPSVRATRASRERRPSAVQLRKKMLPLQFVRTTENISMLSPDMEARIYDKICKSLGKKFGGLEKAQQAAAIIQKAYRVRMLRKHFNEIRRDGVAGHMSRRSSVVAKERWGVVKQQALDLSDIDSVAESSDSAHVNASDFEPRTLDGAAGNPYATEAAPCTTEGSCGDTCDVEASWTGAGGAKKLRRCQSLTPAMTIRLELVEGSEGEEEGEDECCGSNEAAYWNRMVGIHLFNRKPASGIQYLISKGILRDTPRSVAKFLKEQNGLSKMKIGEFIGEIRYEFNMAVLEHLAHSIDMKDRNIDEALREFQTLFLMPGEAQKIDRIMQIFAAEYIDANGIQFGSEDHKQLSVLEYLTASQWEFETEDAVYVLSFSIMMLHTSLHNPSVKHRDSKEQWIKMNRGINGGGNFSKQFLLGIYDRIQKTSFVTGQDHTQKVAEIHQKLVGSDILKMSTSQRCFVDEVTVFELDKVNSWKKGKHKRVLLMFNDLVVVAKKNKEQYMFKRSFSLLNAAAVPYQSADLPDKYGVQIYSSVDQTLLFQCCCRTQSEYERLLKNLNDSIKLLTLLEKERITATQEQPHRHASKNLLYSKTGGVISALQEMSKARSTEYLPSVGNLHCSINSSLGLKPLSATNLSVALENLHKLDDESRSHTERRHLIRSMINIRSDDQVSDEALFDDEQDTSFEANEPSFDGVKDLRQINSCTEPSQRMEKRPVSISAGKMDLGLYDMDKLIPCTFHPSTVSVV